MILRSFVMTLSGLSQYRALTVKLPASKREVAARYGISSPT